MLLAVVAVWLWLANARQQADTSIPDSEISYLGGGNKQPEDLAGLREVPPARATAILFKGGFGWGDTDRVRAALDAAPHVHLVAFDSPGGRPYVADGIANLIWERHLDTYVDQFCASACTLAFAAGTVRSAGAGAEFGFHRAEAPALNDLANINITRIERKWFVRGRVSLSFGNRALHAPNEKPYYPPLDELVAAGYLHNVITPATPSQPNDPVTDPLLAVLHEVEPQTARILADGVRRRVRGGMKRGPARAIEQVYAGLVVDRWFSRSSDAAVLALTDATLEALSALDPVACMRWQVGLTDQYRAFTILPPALRSAFLSAQAAVLRDANADPLPLPDEETYADADAAVRHAVARDYGTLALSNASTPEHAFDDPARSCAVSIAYLRGLRERPEGAALLRWALASG
jgi:hypothetical protein